MKRDFDVAIVGGGLNGSLLALALAAGGFRVCLLDAQAAATKGSAAFDGRAYALSASSVAALEGLGIWAGIVENAQPINDIKVTDGRPGEGASPLFLHFDHRELDGGPFGHIVEDRFLRAALSSALDRAQGIDTKHETTVVEATQGYMVTAAGTDIRVDLIVGCDGRDSAVARFAGIGRMGWGYDQSAVVCAVAHEKPHDGIAHQFFTPSGPLAILPLPGNNSSIVWSETTTRADQLIKLKQSAFINELRPVFGSFLGDISPVNQKFAYPLGLSLADSFVQRGFALVGDAAHGIHPLAGQGLNLGIRDVAALAEVLVEARRRGEDIAALNVLNRYQQWRRFDTAGLAVATDAINRLFSNDNPILRLGRDMGLAAVGRLPALRRRLMREAAGLEGDLPRLLRGLPL